MSGNEMGMRIGAQAQAAASVSARAPEVEAALRGLASGFNAELPRLRGRGPAAIAEAAEGWFAAAATLPTDLDAYARSLVQVDVATASVEREVGAKFNKFAAMLGGGQ
ncbi:MAG: hypothetical protein Q3997_04880 [Propionibacteriaceae bacterium]|nr:hypothetical protein [Propionibacteriaceae bacterium]